MAHGDLSIDDKKIIDEETSILENIFLAIDEEKKKQQNFKKDFADRLISLREEAKSARAEDLPALFDQMNTQRALFDHNSESTLPSVYSPYFAHLIIKEGDRVRHILLGHQSFLEEIKFPIIDWRNAPISKVFFQYREEEEFEERLPGRPIEGVVIARRLLTIDKGELVHISSMNSVFRKIEGQWKKMNSSWSPTLKGGAGSSSRNLTLGTGLSAFKNPDIAGLLDQNQFALLNSPDNEPLLILGGAGCGKTTVALYRMAALNFKNKTKYKPQAMLVVVPEEGLVRLSLKQLRSLGLEGTEVITIDKWIEQQARRLFKRLPKKVYQYTPSRVIWVKRHPAIRFAYKELMLIQSREIYQRAKVSIASADVIEKTLLERNDLNLLEKLNLSHSQYLSKLEDPSSNTSKQALKSANLFFEKMKTIYLDMNRDRIELFTNEELLSVAALNSNGEITDHDVKIVLKHSVEQTKPSSSDQYQGIDGGRLETVDGRALTDEDDNEIVNTLDAEDFSVMLDLYFHKTGKLQVQKKKIKHYNHIVVDEAQDLAPLELSILGKSLLKGGSVTIAGDSAQQTDPSTCFRSWESVLDSLGVKRVKENHLETTYRSTKPIADFAHKILGDIAPKKAPESIKGGVDVTFSQFQSDGPMTVVLNEALSDLMVEEPSASCAVICKTPEMAELIYQKLKDIPKTRLVLDGDFDFTPGIDITEVSQVKGLEFDYVVLPDVNFSNYSQSNEDRRTPRCCY